MIERIITSPWLYPLWRIGWLERAFFLTCRLFDRRTAKRVFDMTKQGFDISYYQGVVDFVKMKLYGALFVILRVAHGVTQDPRFQEYITYAHGLLPLSVYHYYEPDVDPIQQANKVIAILSPHKNKIRRVWLDFEFTWSGAFTDPRHWITYRNAIKAAGFKVGIYTRATWWDSRVGIYASAFADDPLWAAQYNSQLTLIPKGWKERGIPAMVWQDGTPAIGNLAGVSSIEVDRDRWNDVFDFGVEWGTTQPEPPPIGDTMYQCKIKSTATPYVNVRAAPNSTSADIGNAYPGEAFQADELTNGYLHAVVPFVGYVSAQYCDYSLITTPPPPPARKVTHIDIALAAGSVVTRTYDDGTTKSETA